MSDTTTERDAALEDIYSRIPDVQCRGLCYEACGPVGMSEAEAARMIEAGFTPPDFVAMINKATYSEDLKCLTCPLLTAERRCGAYNVRPLVCRLFGAAETMQCPFGCRPAEFVTDTQAMTMFRKAEGVIA